MLVEAVIPLRVKTAGQWRFLEPGKPFEFADDQAVKLLAKMPDKVRQVTPDKDEAIVIDPASPMARPIYWESMDGTWHGPVKPEYLGRTGTVPNERFWVIVNDEGNIRWIWADLLRSHQAFSNSRCRQVGVR